MDIILKAVLNKVAVWKQMYANHEATADEINDRNWHGMCVVLTDRISELEAQLAEKASLISDGADLYYNQERKIELLEAKLAETNVAWSGTSARLVRLQKQLEAVRDVCKTKSFTTEYAVQETAVLVDDVLQAIGEVSDG